MKLIESILTNNPCYKQGRKITVKGLMLHSVGCAQPSAAVFIKNWNKASYDKACVHGFIDGNDGENFMTEGLIELWDLLDDESRKDDKK